MEEEIINMVLLPKMHTIKNFGALAEGCVTVDLHLKAIEYLDEIITLAQEAKTILQEQDVPTEGK
jgi:hypothetical protein